MIISSSYRYFQLKFVITIFLLNFFNLKVCLSSLIFYPTKKLLLNIISILPLKELRKNVCRFFSPKMHPSKNVQ